MIKLKKEEKTGIPEIDIEVARFLEKIRHPDGKRGPGGIPDTYFVRIAEKGYVDEIAAKMLTDEQRWLLAQALMKSRINRVKADPSFFIFNYVYTLDPHDSVNPIKKMPYKQYLYYVIETWRKTQLLVIPKSRQMMISWVMIALHYWLAAYHPGQHVFFQSKKFEDADILLERAKFIHDHVPDWLKVDGSKTEGWFSFDAINSKIQAVSQEGDAIRMQTASAVFSDEVAFQPYAAEGYAAAKPTIDGGGKWTGVSTANGKEFFNALVSDIEWA